jgi:hypothetical protein
MKKILIFLIVLVVLLVAVPYVVIFYTPIPLKVVASLLAKTGVEMTGISGNIGSGFSIDTLKFSQEGNDFEFHKLTLRYSNETDPVGGETLIFDEMSVDGFKVLVKNLPKPKWNEAANPQNEPAKKEKASPPSELFAGRIKGITYAKISAKNGEIVVPGMKDPFLLKSAAITQLDISGTGMRLGGVVFESDRLDLKVPALEVTHPSKVIMRGDATLSLKPSLIPALKKEWSTKFRWGSSKTPGSPVPQPTGQLTAFNDQALLKMDPDGSLSLSIKDLDLSEWFFLTSNLKTLQLEVKAKNLGALIGGAVESSGNLKIDDRAFSLQLAAEPGTPFPKLIAFEEKNGVRLMALIDPFIKALPPALLISSSANPQVLPISFEWGVPSTPGSTPADAGALFFFAKPFKRLNPREKADLDGKLKLIGIQGK